MERKYFLRKTKRKYVARPKSDIIVLDGYLFSLDKKFYGFVSYYKKLKKWEAFEIYSGRLLGEGDTRREAIRKAITYLENMDIEEAFAYAESLKERGTPRGINSRSLR